MATWNFHGVLRGVCCLLINKSRGPSCTNSSTMISVTHKHRERRGQKQPYTLKTHLQTHSSLRHLLSWLRTHTPYSSTMCLWDTCRIMLAVSKKACTQKDRDNSTQGTLQKPLVWFWNSLLLLSRIFEYSKMLQNGWSALKTKYTGSVSVSHQWDVPVSRTQHLQDHLHLLGGWVPSILLIVLYTFHHQWAWVDVGSCARAKVLLLVHTTQKSIVRTSFQTTATTRILEH